MWIAIGSDEEQDEDEVDEGQPADESSSVWDLLTPTAEPLVEADWGNPELATAEAEAVAAAEAADARPMEEWAVLDPLLVGTRMLERLGFCTTMEEVNQLEADFKV